MLKPTEKALQMFSDQVKELIAIDAENKLQRAVIIYLCTKKINEIKRALYDASQLDDVLCKKSITYWQDVQSALNEMNPEIKTSDTSLTINDLPNYNK